MTQSALGTTRILGTGLMDGGIRATRGMFRADEFEHFRDTFTKVPTQGRTQQGIVELTFSMFPFLRSDRMDPIPPLVLNP